MSKTVKGTVQTTSDKDSKDFFGICIDDHWYNRPDSLEKDLEGETVELTVDPEADFIDIEEIDIIEEDSEDDEQGRGSNPADGERESSNSRSKTSSDTSMSERQAGKLAVASTMQARQEMEMSYTDNEKKYLEKLDDLSKGIQGVMERRLGENLE